MKTTMILSVATGLAFFLPGAANAQSDGAAKLTADAHYCSGLLAAYVSAHPNAKAADGTIDQKADCVGNPEGTISNITAQMQKENMPVPPRP